MSQLTTHILDTTKGKPANGVHVTLYNHKLEEWLEIAKGTTNQDGRISDLLDEGKILKLGTYKLKFEVQSYYGKQSVQTIYPFIEIIFQITTEDHYHIPLLLSPFGYSTYRGS